MRRLGLGVFICLFGAVLSGCIQVDQEITFCKNGSGSIKLHYAVSKKMQQQIEMMGRMGNAMGEGAEQADVQVETPFDIEEIKKDIEALKDKGVVLNSLKEVEKNGWHHLKVDIAFKSLAMIKDTSFFQDMNIQLTRNDAGDYVLTQATNMNDAADMDQMPQGEADNPMMEQMVKQMLKGFRVSTDFTVPGTIIETTAHNKMKYQAKWLYDTAKDPDAFKQCRKAKIKIVFSGDGIELPEIRPVTQKDTPKEEPEEEQKPQNPNNTW